MTGLAARITEEGARLASACTACGACVTACPMTPYAKGVEAADPALVAGGMRAVLLGQDVVAPEAVAWIGACTRSAQCNAACPEMLDVALMLRFASMRARGATGETLRYATKSDPGWSSRVKAFARVTLTEEEQARWL
ncbi:MAG: (Fe-S)-binding protein [Acetobacteraceae bacterium]|nr:(Fe-S)-binding protein [Acetobacteraceae bacterium]